MIGPIYLDAPNIGGLEKQHVLAALESGYVSTAGPLVAQFEDAFAAYLNTPAAVSTQSGTAALHMALHELGVGKGDEVIVPALTFAATINPIIYVGARPVFVDVDPLTWTMDPARVEERLSARTKAILPVHLYGNPCDMDAILSIARAHRLFVIEDATESLGAFFRQRPTGTFGEFGCFSFNGNKTMTTGGGGMIVGTDTRRLEHIKFLVNQARDTSIGYYHPEIGYNYRMTNLEAALGLAQIQRLDEFLTRKRSFYHLYKEAFAGRDDILFQTEHPHGSSAWWLSSIAFADGVDIPRLQQTLKDQGIPTRRIFMPVTEFPPYKPFADAPMPHSQRIYRTGLSLPCSTLNSEQTIRDAARLILKAL